MHKNYFVITSTGAIVFGPDYKDDCKKFLSGMREVYQAKGYIARMFAESFTVEFQVGKAITYHIVRGE